MKHSRKAAPWWQVIALGGTLALLFWLKLRVVTGVPRTAIADPEQARTAAVHPGGEAPAK